MATDITGTGNYWLFSSDGITLLPGDLELNSTGNIRGENGINIEVNLSDSTLRRWQFSEGGDLIFPDNTVQTTAYTGGVVIPAASNSVFSLGTDFTGTIVGDFGNGTGYIRVESNTGAPNFSPAPISTEFYNFLSTITAGTEFTVHTVVDGTTYNTVVSFTEFSGGNPVAPNRNDLYYTFVSGDTLPFSYDATALTLTFEGSAFSFTTSAVTFPDGTVQTTAYTGSTVIQGEYIYEFDGVNTDLTITNLNCNLLFCTVATGYSGSATHNVNLPNGTPGQRLVIINTSTNCTLTIPGFIDPWSITETSGPAEFIYTSTLGWYPMYGIDTGL